MEGERGGGGGGPESKNTNGKELLARAALL